MSAGQNLGHGAAGVAMLHLETGNWPAAYAALEQAVEGGVSIAEGASLYYGAPALAFVLAGCDHPALASARDVAAHGTATVIRRKLEAAHRRIDQRQQAPYAEYDLIRGLTGLGVVLRRLHDDDLLRDVLAYLVRLTEPIGELPGWWSPHGPGRDRPWPAGGHSNHGIAHGITGPLALLALTLADGIVVAGHEPAIGRICDWLDRWQQGSDDGLWWPQTIGIGELRHGQPSQQSPQRPSWCYGTPGIARAQQLAAIATANRTRQNRAEAALAVCLADDRQQRLLTDNGLCHGLAGVFQTAWRAAQDAATPAIAGCLPTLAHLLRRPDAPGDAGLLEGDAGVALVRHTAIRAAAPTTGWDSCLLIG